MQISFCKKSLAIRGARIIRQLFKQKGHIYKAKGCHNLYVYSKALVIFLNYFYEIPIGKKYEKIKVPSSVNSKKQIIYFIKGLMDSDGNIYLHRKRLCFQLRQKSENFIKEVHNLFIKIGLKINNPYYDKANHSWVIWCSKKTIVDNFIKEIDALKIGVDS